jgi:nicotinamidase-related amidase
MTTLAGRPHTALVVVDVQNGVVEGAHDRDKVVANVATLVARARAGRVPVVWVQHNAEDLPVGSDEWRFVPELSQAEEEPVVHKQFGDSFEETDLEDVLASAGAGHLVVAGAATDACVRSTIHGAVTRGYDVTLVGDAHTTGDLTSYGAPPPEAVIAHTNLYWSFHEVPGRTTAVVDTAEVDFAGDQITPGGSSVRT